MKAAIFRGNHEIVVEDRPDPRIEADDECLVRVMACGICGTDKHIYATDDPPASIMGHEAVGEVIEVGKRTTRLTPGDRVAVYNLIGCGECADCRRGRITWCENTRGSVNGGFGELLVAPERNLFALPGGLDWMRACLMTDVLGTPMKAIRTAGVGEGDTVVVLGCGPIGLGAVQIAIARGARVMAVDLLDYRLVLAHRLGAEVTCNPLEESAVTAARRWTGRGAHHAFDCTGAEGLALTALDSLRPGGTAMCVGRNMRMDFSPWTHIVSRDVKLGGSWYLHYEDYDELLRLWRAGMIDPLPLLTHTVPLEEIALGFEVFAGNEDGAVKVVVLLGLR